MSLEAWGDEDPADSLCAVDGCECDARAGGYTCGDHLDYTYCSDCGEHNDWPVVDVCGEPSCCRAPRCPNRCWR